MLKLDAQERQEGFLLSKAEIVSGADKERIAKKTHPRFCWFCERLPLPPALLLVLFFVSGFPPVGYISFSMVVGLVNEMSGHDASL